MEFLVAACVLLPCLLPLLWTGWRGGPGDAVAALAMAATVIVAVLLVLTAAFGRSAFFELPEVLAIVSFVGSVAFARYLERWV
jgi:multisubunit Na+/H+ antiporter MnhF subunit